MCAAAQSACPASPQVEVYRVSHPGGAATKLSGHGQPFEMFSQPGYTVVQIATGLLLDSQPCSGRNHSVLRRQLELTYFPSRTRQDRKATLDHHIKTGRHWRSQQSQWQGHILQFVSHWPVSGHSIEASHWPCGRGVRFPPPHFWCRHLFAGAVHVLSFTEHMYVARALCLGASRWPSTSRGMLASNAPAAVRPTYIKTTRTCMTAWHVWFC
jgi:hypothetical protein